MLERLMWLRALRLKFIKSYFANLFFSDVEAGGQTFF